MEQRVRTVHDDAACDSRDAPERATQPPQRQRFFEADENDGAALADAACDGAHALLRLLLVQDGSTTRLCEAIAAGAPLRLLIHRQRVQPVIPAAVRALLPDDEPLLERIVSICARDRVMLDALSYIAPARLPEPLRRELDSGAVPLGRMFDRLWIRREFLPPTRALGEPLWDAVGLPDAAATRSLRIATPEGPFLVLTETFRRGMREPR